MRLLYLILKRNMIKKLEKKYGCFFTKKVMDVFGLSYKNSEKENAYIILKLD